MEKPAETLPHWDLTAAYPDVESDQLAEGMRTAVTDIEALTDLFDENGIDRLESAPLDEATVALYEDVTNRLNVLLEHIYTLNAYLSAKISVNSRDTTAQARQSELQQHLARLSNLGTRFTAWLGSLDVEALIEQSEEAAENSYILRRARESASHLMSPAEESLAADLRLTGSGAWNRMFSNTTSQLTVDVTIDGEKQNLPLTAAQNLMFHPERELRREAHESILHKLESVAVPMAAALNSVKGETITLARRRHWESPLEMVLFNNAIDRETLDAMMAATHEAIPHFHRYLRARARALGLPLVTWYDRLVPLGQGSQAWEFDDAARFVIDQFGTYSARMRGLAERAFDEMWIDAEPRAGKRGGAFCMWLKEGESRILSNFEPSFTSVGTLAHELGHAYHNFNLADRKAMQRAMPMTLAETASTFCQKIVENAALETADKADRMILLDGLLEYAARVVLGATSDFIFEESVFERRQQRELSPEEFTELALAAQRATLGDAVDPDVMHPFRWVYVPHYYVTSYYNFPYTFGLLFGLGLYAIYRQEPETFKAGYDDLLAATGMEDAAGLAQRFGIDIRSTDFWRASFDVLRADIDRFDALVTGPVAAG